MQGIFELSQLLKSLSPELQKGEFVFCTVKGDYSEYQHLQALGIFKEEEGLTLILPVEAADGAKIAYESKFKQITLTVHSSLDAVGLTAAVASKLAAHGISANVVAAYYHDHIFVQSEKAQAAMTALSELCCENS